jgi:molybdenum cofactor biosynthesis enzyme
LDLPDSVLTIIGTFLDFGGVILKIIGVLTKYSLTIGFAVTTLSLLNTVMGTSITLQTILGSLFGLVAAKVGVQAIAVSGLSSVFLNLAIITKGTLLVAIKFIISSIVTLTIKIATLTATILTNPLFLAGTAIAASIYLIVEAIKEIIDELGLFEKETANTTGVSREFTGVLTTLKNAARAVFGVFKDLAQLIAVGLTAPVLFAVKAWLHMKKAMADNKNEAFGIQQQIEKVNAQLEKLGEISLKAQEGFRGLVAGGTAQAAENQRIEYEKLGKATENFASKLEKVKSITSEVGAQFKLLNFGDQFDKAKNSIDVTRTAYNKLLDSFINGGKDSKVSVDDLKKGYEDLLGAFQQAKDLSQQTFDGLIAGAKRVNLELMKSSGNILQATRMENEERLKLFDKQVSNLEKIGLLSEQQEKQLADARLAIVRKNQADIDKIKQKAAQKEADFFARMQNENINLLQQEKEASGQFVAAQNIAGMMALQAHDEKIKRFVEEQKLLDENFKLSKAQLDIIKQQREAIIAKNEANVVEAAKKEQDAAQKAAGPEAPQIFGPQQVDLIGTAFGEGAEAIAGAASSMLSPLTAVMAAAPMIVGAIQGLIDFVPNLLDSIANIFNTLTELPLKAAEAFSGLVDSLGNVLANLAPNIIKGFTKNISTLVRLIFETLPDAFTEMPVLLIEALMDFIGKLPEFIKKLAIGFIRGIATAPIKIIKALADGVPVLIAELLKAIPEVAIALVDGLIIGLKEAVNALANLFGFDDLFDMPEIEEQISKLSDDIKRASSQIFQVLDLEASQRGLDVADRIRNAIISSSSRGADIFSKYWKKLKSWFENKFGPIVSEAWQGFTRNVEDQSEGFGRNISDQFKGFIRNVTDQAEGFGRNVSDQSKGFADNIAVAAKGFGDNVAVAWKGFADNVGVAAQGFGDNISVAAKGFGRNISDQFKGLLDNIANIKIPDLPDLPDFPELPSFPSIETPSWLQNFIDAVSSLTNWSLPFSSGGLVGKVQNSIPSPGGYAGKVVDTIMAYRAEGGPVTVPTGTTKNGILYAQTGSMAQGTDTIPAMLTPGEFVVNREATRNNLGLLSFINQNKDAVSPRAPQNSTFNITINAKTNLDVNTLRREVIPEIEKQLRRKSQEGKSVINAAGIRA